MSTIIQRIGGLGRLGWNGLVVIVALLLLPSTLMAKEEKDEPDLNSLRTEVAELEQLSQGLGIRYQASVQGADQIAEHRLVDAQVLYTLQDYTRAAIILFDYVTKYKNTQGYPEAVFYLADSLYKKRDFLSAKRYFQLVVNEVKGKYYQEALQRLVELSLRTGDSSDVNQYLNALAAIPRESLKPSVPYVWGKYYYFKGDINQALAGFRSVTKDNKYYFHAHYFLGAIKVRQDDFAGAIKTFQELLRLTPKSKSEKHIRDLTYLALGRLLYEQGKINQAIDMYQKVPRQSSEFDASLYEICWAYIKANEYRKALRAVDLLVLAHPESPFIPQVKVLQGNLLIRLEEWGRATDLFTKTREKFMPVHSRMNQVMTEHSDPNIFFDTLLARNQSEMGVQIQLPPLAVHWVKEDSRVKRALNMVQDLRNIEESIKESSELIKRLEHAINTPAKIKIFPEFAAAKAQSLEVENRLIMARRGILNAELDLVATVASSSEKDQLRRLSEKRAALEQKVKELPTTMESFESREKTKVKKLSSLEKELNKLAVIVDSMRAQMVASEKFFNDTKHAKNRSIRESFRKETEDIRVMLIGLQAEVDEIRQSLVDAKTLTGVGGSEEVAERNVKSKYRDALNEEHQFLATLRSRLGPAEGGEFDGLASLHGRCDRIDTVLTNFDKQLDAGVEEKLVSIRTALKEETALMTQYSTESTEFKAQTDGVAGAITYEGFRAVAKRFYEIVVRADVGIIDVSWALKDSKSKEVSRLVKQQKMDLKLLDDEFKEVLQEE